MVETKKEIPVLNLNFKEAFLQLNNKEKKYAYYLYKACWAGFPIVLFQVSHESPFLFIIYQNFFSSFKPFNQLKSTIQNTNKNITDEDYKNFIEFAAKCYSNGGNYESFGKRKFIPELPIEKFESILKTSQTYQEISEIWEKVKNLIYENSSSFKTINLEEKNGKNAYYLGGIKEEEIKMIDQYLQQKNIDPLNTRLLKVKDNKFVVLIGSAEEKEEQWTEQITAQYGEFSSLLKRVNQNLTEAMKYCYNDIEKKMFELYIESFNTGSIEKHKDSQRQWVKNKHPLIETNIGWIETYIDPLGVRGYYEGFVALTDKEKSKKFNTLVENAEKLIGTFPWSKDFEKPVFTPPDFIALDILCFASDSCPIGINIPNYQDVQETDGFKNVSLTNAYPTFKGDRLRFANEQDKELLTKFGQLAMVVKVAGHELLGHGSGKLLRMTKENEYNFEKGKLINPLTNSPVDKCYGPNETFETKFTFLCRSIEECRADLVGLFFGFNKDVQKIFEVNENDFEDVIYTMWLSQFRKGILGLTLFNTENKKWGQAHTQGAWVFTHFILENQKKGEEILTVQLDEANKTFHIKASKENIIKHGKKLVEDILIKIHIWKAIGDFEDANTFYEKYSHVDEMFLKIREILLENEPPRRLELNHNLKIDQSGSVSIIEYPETVEGIIESFVDRYGTEFNKEIYEELSKLEKKINKK